VETFLNRTCPHEVAHLVTFQVFGERGHGPKWKQVMQALNVQDDSRCHSYDTSSVARTYTVRRWHYNCACKTHTVSTTVHNRILRGARYTCKRCGTGIQIG
jgi:SprT protein